MVTMNIAVVLKSEIDTQAPVLKARLPTCGAMCDDVLTGASEDSALYTGRLQVTGIFWQGAHHFSKASLYNRHLASGVFPTRPVCAAYLSGIYIIILTIIQADKNHTQEVKAFVSIQT